jgi:Domain of unknown function (DUF4394)
MESEMKIRHSVNCNLRRHLTVFAASLVALLVVGYPIGADSRDDRGNEFDKLKVFGLTSDGRLVRFRADKPEQTKNIGYIAGLSGVDSALVGIDFRVQDGRLYGVGNSGGVYTIDTTTAQASFVNSLTVQLSGTNFGVDFNPAADRLRIISDTGQNLAHNVNAGGVTASNGMLTYTAPPPAPVAALGVTAAAYTNNDLNQPTTGTTLFDLDTTLDQIVIQSPPGNGILVAAGQLGVDAEPHAGLDIYTRLNNGVAVANRAFASLSINGKSAFFRINLLTGKATWLGTLGEAVVDIAIPLEQ